MRLAAWIGGTMMCLLVSSCGAPEALEEEAMVETLAALYLLDARQNEVGDVPEGVRDSVLRAHGITPAELRTQLELVTRNPVQAESLFARVERRLAVLSDQPAEDISRSR